jgi:hypothetical protein
MSGILSRIHGRRAVRRMIDMFSIKNKKENSRQRSVPIQTGPPKSRCSLFRGYTAFRPERDPHTERR